MGRPRDEELSKHVDDCDWRDARVIAAREYKLIVKASSARRPGASALMEGRLIEPDIARSAPGEPPSGVGERFETWLWDTLESFL
jgi:hypothetical protein